MGHLLKSINPEASDAIKPGPEAARRPDVGEIVIYHMRAGHARQGRTRFPALVQNHGERGTLGLTVILEAAELKNETLVDEIGPGRDSHVWERPDGAHLAEIFRGTLTALHERIGQVEAENKTLRDLMLGDYDRPVVSVIHIMVDFENRLRLMAEQNASLREHLMSEPATDGLPRPRAVKAKARAKKK